MAWKGYRRRAIHRIHSHRSIRIPRKWQCTGEWTFWTIEGYNCRQALPRELPTLISVNPKSVVWTTHISGAVLSSTAQLLSIFNLIDAELLGHSIGGWRGIEVLVVDRGHVGYTDAQVGQDVQMSHDCGALYMYQSHVVHLVEHPSDSAALGSAEKPSETGRFL